MDLLKNDETNVSKDLLNQIIDMLLGTICLRTEQLSIQEIKNHPWMTMTDPDVKMARLANYNNFSESMVSDKNKTAISVEYFVFKNDEIWNMKDEEIITFLLLSIRCI